MNAITGREFLFCLDTRTLVIIYLNVIVYRGELGKMEYYTFLKIADRDLKSIKYDHGVLMLDFTPATTK